MKIADIRAMTEVELRGKAQDLRQEALNLRIQQQSGRLERPSRLKDIRRTIAKIETILTEKLKGAAQKEKTSAAA